MRTGGARTLISLLTLIGFIILAGPATAGSERGRPVFYLALGDSLSKGVQPFGAGGANVATDEGYVNQLFAALKSSNPRLELHQLGCEVTETTKTMLRGGGTCTYAHGSQLGDAIAFLRKHRGSIALVTINIGANDIEPCAQGLDIDDECIQKAFIQVSAHLPPILGALHLAAGSHVPIVGMSYYNPILAAWLALGPGAPDGNLGQQVALESAEKLAAFNGLLGAIYRFFRIPVADVAAAFHTAEFEPLVPFPFFGEVPLNVATLCALSHMCTAATIHANADGCGHRRRVPEGLALKRTAGAPQAILAPRSRPPGTHLDPPASPA
jgi:lysophospholipase L1-like esterase